MKIPILKKLFNIRVIRFLFVGVLNSLFGFTVFSVISHLNGSIWQALLGGNVAGIAFNFLTIGGIVFRDLSPKRLVRFVAAYAGLFFLNLQTIEVLMDILQSSRILTQALLTAPMAILSYLVMRRFVFPSQANMPTTLPQNQKR